MIDHIRNLARHSSIYTISTFLQRALGFILLPVYTDTAYIASQSEYGDMALVYTFIAFMTIVYLYGMDAALMRYFFLGRYPRRDVYTSGFYGVLFNGMVLSVLLWVFSGPIAGIVLGSDEYAFFIRLAAAILFFDGLGNLPYLILRAEEKSVTYSAVRVGRFVLELTLNIIFVVWLKKGVAGILYANLLASIVNFLALLPFQLGYLKGRFNRDAFVEMAKFGLPMLPNGLAYLTVEISDKYLMRILIDKETVGMYSANYKFGSLFLLVVIAFRTAWQPFFLKLAGDEKAKTIYARVLTYFTLAGVFIIVTGSYFIEYVVRIPLAPGKTIMGMAYWPGVKIIPVILAAYLFYGLYVNFTVGIYIQKKTRWMVVFTGLAALVNVGSNMYLMPNFGMMGAAVATLLSYLTMAAAIFIANQRIYPVHYEYSRLGGLLILLVILLAVYYLWQPAWYARILIIASAFVLLWAGNFWKAEEVRTLKRWIRGRV